MKLTLNIHGSLAKFYREFYNRTKLPNNLCNYFWSLVLAFIFLPFVYPVLIINRIFFPYYYDKDMYKEYRESAERVSTIFGLLINFLFIAIGLLFQKIVYGDLYSKIIPVWKTYTNGFISIVAIVFSIWIIFHIVKFIIKLFPKKHIEKEELSAKELEELEKLWQEKQRKKQLKKEKSFWYLLKKYFIAWKDKNCPIIEWDDNTNNKAKEQQSENKNEKMSAIVGQGESEPPNPIRNNPIYIYPEIPESEQLPLQKEKQEKKFMLLGLNGYNSPIQSGIFDTVEEAEKYLYNLKGFYQSREYIYWRIEEWNRNPNPHYIPKP